MRSKHIAGLLIAYMAFIANGSAERIQVPLIAPDVESRYISTFQQLFHSHHPATGDDEKGVPGQSPSSGLKYLTDPSKQAPVDIAQAFVRSKVPGKDGSSWVVKNAYKSSHNGVTHVYLRQMMNGMEVENGDFNINIDSMGRVLSYGDSFYRGAVPQSGSSDVMGGSRKSSSNFK
jgi:hypothetical protein